MELIRAEGERRVLAHLVLADMGAQARQQDAHPDRFGDVIIGAGIEAENRVRVAVQGGQHDHRRVDALPPQHAADVAAIYVRQSYIQQDGGIRVLARSRDRGLPGVGFLDVKFPVQALPFR